MAYRRNDVQREFDDFTEESRQLEAELEMTVEQQEKKIRDLNHFVNQLKVENESYKVSVFYVKWLKKGKQMTISCVCGIIYGLIDFQTDSICLLGSFVGHGGSRPNFLCCSPLQLSSGLRILICTYELFIVLT